MGAPGTPEWRELFLFAFLARVATSHRATLRFEDSDDGKPYPKAVFETEEDFSQRLASQAAHDADAALAVLTEREAS